MSFQRPVVKALPVNASSILAEAVKKHIDAYMSEIGILKVFDKLEYLDKEIAALKHQIEGVALRPEIENDQLTQDVNDMRTKIDELENAVLVCSEMLAAGRTITSLLNSVTVKK